MGRAVTELERKGGLDQKKDKISKKEKKGKNCQKRMKSSASFPLAACCFILLHLSLVPICQAAVSECLTCMAIKYPPSAGIQDSSAADACRAGNPANIPKIACKAPKNHGCGVVVRKSGGMETFTRSCCSDSGSDRCQEDLHQKFNGPEYDADSCMTDNCNTMDPSSAVMTKMFPYTILLLVLLF